MSLFLIFSLLAAVNPDWQAENRRVEQRVAQEEKGNSSGAQYFWSDTPKAKILARMLDRVWRAALLLDSCHTTLSKIHRMLFPHNPQPQGLKALADQFQDGKSVKTIFNALLVAGANIALAYFSKHRPGFAIHKVMMDIPDEQHYTQTLGAARWMVRQVQDQTDRLVGPLEGPKCECVEAN